MKRKIKVLIAVLVMVSLVLTGCSLPGLRENAKKDVVIAAANDTERQILAEMQKQMIEHYTDRNVSIINNLGSTTMIHATMLDGDVNMAAGMYSGTSLTGELRMKPIRDSEKALKAVQKGYKEKFNRVWFPSYGFANTYAFMVRKDFAEEHNIKKVSDLIDLRDSVRVGVDTAWMDRKGDGYEAFQEIYGYKFKKIYPMELGLLYSAVKNKEMDVILGYSTDGRIPSYNLVVLEDDMHLFPAYDCSPVATKEILEKYPELTDVIFKLCGEIDTTDMQKMNREAAEDLMEPQVVAKKFLEKHNYFEDKNPKKNFDINKIGKEGK